MKFELVYNFEKWEKIVVKSSSVYTILIQFIYSYFQNINVTIGSSVTITGRVSIQGVKSLWGDHVVFPRLGTGDTDR